PQVQCLHRRQEADEDYGHYSRRDVLRQDPMLQLPPGLFDDDEDDTSKKTVAFDPAGMLTTSVIISKIPDEYTPALLLKDIEDGGFRHMVDFDKFIMPVDGSTGMHQGYGLLTFSTAS
ncbi:unnamed protein product, partial [Polarella glacialis]